MDYHNVADWLLSSTKLNFPMDINTLYSCLVDDGVVKSVPLAAKALNYIQHTLPTSLQMQQQGTKNILTFADLDTIEVWRRGIVPWVDESDSERSFTLSNSTIASSVEEGWTYNKQDEPVSSDVRSMLAAELFGKSAAKDLASDFDQLLYEPSFALTTFHSQTIARTPLTEFVQICSHNTGCMCKDKLHLERIVVSNTDHSLGDCNYLDTCFKGRSCRYVHYKVQPPKSCMVLSSNPDSASAPSNVAPAQYIQCNLRQIDLSKMGSDYGVIVADPPWEIHMNGNKGGSSSMSDDDFAKLNIQSLQTEGVMFLWVTGRAIDAGRRCLKKWGYTSTEELLWIKVNQLGRTIGTGRTGHWLNHTKEHLLVGIKGNPKFLTKQLELDLMVSVSRGSSRKPEELYGIIERLAGGCPRKLELFGRDNNIRPGWLTMGNEISGTNLHDPLLKFRWSRASRKTGA